MQVEFSLKMEFSLALKVLLFVSEAIYRVPRLTTGIRGGSCHGAHLELQQYDDVSERGGEHGEESGLVQGEVGGGTERIPEPLLE